jgi:zinc/manganese transport system permease protein
MEALLFLAAPFVMCLLLVGIHCYLGMHVLARGVVFVDLSLAQVACFGAAIGLLIDPEHHSMAGYFTSLAATLMAAALFTLARRFEKMISQEALIGITYAFASAAIILILDRLPHGAEHLKEILVGQILWVTWSDVGKTFGTYLLVGLIHYLFRKQFIQQSFSDQKNHWFWDFAFYALFGIVITSSTSVAGVLLVFSFLIVPSVVSTFFFKTLKARLWFGWLFGSVLSLLGLWLSYKIDLPVGAVLVVLLTVLPLLLVCFLAVFKKNAHSAAS